jgi:MOSC domain-containing protein YiiM
MHLDYETLARQIRELPQPPRDEGTVTLLVVRPETNARLTLDRYHLTPAGGVEGDAWGKKCRRSRAAQVTAMRADVARVFADGQPLSLFGDNLLVELDLSAENLPAGSLLQIGTAECEVTPLAHTGCGKFAGRFGADARKITTAAEFHACRLRGIHLKVVEPGVVCLGDTIRVLIRPPAEAEQ